MSKANSPTGPDAEREVTGVIERVIADVPAPHTRPVPDPGRETDRIAQRAARHQCRDSVVISHDGELQEKGGSSLRVQGAALLP